MKPILFTIATLCFIQPFFSQEISVNWSKSEWKRWLRSITPIDSSTAVVFKISGILCKLDKIEFTEGDTLRKTETNLKYESMYRLGDDDPIFLYQKSIQLNNFNWVSIAGKKCFLRKSFSKNVATFYVDVLDDQLQETGEKIILLEKDYSFSDKQGSMIMMNENYLMVWAYTYNRELKSNDGIDVTVIDKQTAKVILSKTVRFPEITKDMNLMESPFITSDGNVALLFHLDYYSNYYKKEINPLVTSDKIVQLLISEEELIESSTILPKGMFVDEVDLFEKNGKVYFPMIGKLISDHDRPIAVSVMMNSWDDELRLINYESVKDPIPGHKYIGLALYSFQNHASHSLEDGSFIIVSQKTASFADEDIMVSKILYDGEVEWTRYFSHRSLTEGADRMETLTGGIFSYIDSDGQLIIVLNDNKKCYDENGNYIPGYVTSQNDDMMKHIKNQVSAMIVLDPNTGNMTRQKIKGLPSDKIICPILTQKLADGKYLLYRTNGETENFGILRTK